MCGIFGFNWDDRKLLKDMSEVLIHRGPDDAAFYTDKISLGMRRLAIIDLKKDIYPVTNESKTLIVIFNGELYNYKEIKEDLIDKGHKFITDCDAEIIPHAFEEYGENFLRLVNGMFAIAMYDTKEKKLYLMRDKLGEKPLYYYHDKKRFAFASEIKCLLEIPEFKREINANALNNYFTYRYTPGEETLFSGVKKLLPGHYLTFDTDIKMTKYWSLNFSDNNNSLSQNAKYIRHLLEESVKLRLMSDVPLGAYLSGGLDSSAIVALMAKHTETVNTFNVSFSGTEFDESKYAQIVADKFNTNHTQINIDIDAAKVLPEVLWHLDEPVADAATIPTYLMSKETKKKVTVILSGEGSDELFGGYERFRHLNLANKFRHIPLPLRKFPSMFSRKEDMNAKRAVNLLSNLHNPKEAYLSYYSVFDDDEKKKLYSSVPSRTNPYRLGKYFNKDFFHAVQEIDIKERLPNNMLLKGDKMTMAFSIEGRVPFLDPRLVEFAAKIPFSQKVSLLQDKIVYRKAISSLVPRQIVNRKKQGFTIPTVKWAREGLKDRLFKLIEENKEPFLKKEYIEKITNNIHKSFYYKRQFWAVLMYEEWYNRFMVKR
jgi:asparagine synthase (glutamine-hydrolysing)